jgi:hypothetical protein
MAHVKNLFEGLLSSILLLLRFVMTNPIFGLELVGKTCLPHLKSLVANVFFQGHQTMHLSNNELEVINYGIIELECLKCKLQKPKLIRLDQMWRENGKWKVNSKDLKYNYLMPKCCLMQPFIELNV